MQNGCDLTRIMRSQNLYMMKPVEFKALHIAVDALVDYFEGL